LTAINGPEDLRQGFLKTCGKASCRYAAWFRGGLDPAAPAYWTLKGARIRVN
jgi:hypothetical protein